ncbi:sulfite exporter TauE/SafE family protein [Mucilaginibacter sp.]|uniref:sulfite exporter TauE/SafE family protein n=1 Tax=Mucilaginibacter sp. TaxID=1882438 RepID=UPI000CB58855|nr:sulfite exporter TauE/SafE family protein [Mucilaginibacter sp.]PLW88581.1 MAG: hypothetical protein C0154_15810 [Mucilaginibacter sp.]HEK19421.1 sulfite exporter TauE/SafE family protein [Bacteroidota bacterium]
MLYALFFIIAIVAFGLSAVCGGGASFILLPFLGIILPAAQVPAAMSVGSAASSVSRLLIFKKHIRWDIVMRFVPPALPAVWLGAKLLSSINPAWMEFVIGLFLVINVPFIFKKDAPSQKKRSKWILPVIGLATGFISGLTGAVGLLFNRFYLNYGLSKEQIIATRAANELLLHLVKIILYGAFGLLTMQSAWAGLLISVAAVVSAWCTKKLLLLFTEQGFRRTGFTAMVLSGVLMLASSIQTLRTKENVKLGFTWIEQGMEAQLATKQQRYAVELSLSEGIELERAIKLTDLPFATQQQISRLAQKARIMLIEEVLGWGSRSYELYVKRNGQLIKYDL